MRVEAQALFDEANRLWFADGAAAEALARYEAAARAAPDDPVIQFQLARALWALERREEAAAALAAADAHADLLSPLGREVFARRRPRILASPPTPPPVDASSLDIDSLERLDLPPERWLEIAFSARDREMYGLAAHAFARGSIIQLTELEEEEHEMRKQAGAALDMLEAMRAEPRDRRPRLESARTSTPSTAAAPRPRPASRPHAAAPALEVDVGPSLSGVGDDAVLAVTLRNPTAEPLAVNGRLLLNNPDVPPGYGELALSVEGPPGYANATAFSVRSGAAAPTDFVVLEPGETITRRYRLADYESLHVPGTYRIWATYSNAAPETLAGHRAFVGSVSSQPVSIERWAPEAT